MAENIIIHEIRLAGYKATSTGGMLDLGTWGSYGIEKLHLTLDAAWQDLTITAFFNVNGKVVAKRVVGKDGYADVPWEATKENTFSGCLAFEGSINGQRRISTNLNYKVTNHSETTDSDPVPTDDRWNQFVTETKEYRDGAFEAAERANARAEDAETASEDAQAAARAAKASENAAAASASNAAADAAKAGPYAKAAQAAQEAAENAAAAAAASKAAAETAAKAAQDAQTATATAKAEAVKAQGAAQTAAKSAQDAQAAAENVRDDAQTAQQGAEAARDAAAKSAEAAAKSEANAKQSADTLAESVENVAANTAAVAELKEKKAEIDDTAVGANAWSSKRIIDMFCPPLEESGNPVVCYPVAGYPLGVKAKWEPAQEGTGTPSPENIRPIHGRDSVKVERCGENLLAIKPFNKDTHKGITYEYVPDGGIHVSGTALTSVDSPTFPVWLLPPGKYFGLELGSEIHASIVVQRNGKNLWLNAKGAFEILAGDVTKYWYAIVSAGATVDKTVYPYIVPGTTAPTTYTPYIGQTNTLTLPETMYGGEVDAVRGEGQDTCKTITLDGETNKFTQAGEYWNLPRNSAPGVVGLYATICSHFPANIFCGNQIEEYLYTKTQFMSKYFPDANALNTYLAAQNDAGTPVQIAYKLAEPIPFTATGAQPLPALSGTNTVLTDADSVTVTGRADPIKRIEDLEAAVASIN